MKLGGSTIAAACGLDPFCSPVKLWARLTGRLGDDANEAMEWGNRLEPVIFEALTERGVKAKRTPELELTDAALPWLVGHPDGIVGRTSIVEAKLTARRYGWDIEELPLPWQAQAQTYMRLGGYESAIVAVLVSGTALETVTVYQDAKAQALLLEMGAEFMGYVERDAMPQVRDDDAQTLSALFPSPEPGKMYRLTGDEWETVQELRRLRHVEATVKAQRQELENRIKASAPDAERFVGPEDQPVATWKPATRRAVDVKALREAQPSLAEEFTTETTTRRFVTHDPE